MARRKSRKVTSRKRRKATEVRRPNRKRAKALSKAKIELRLAALRRVQRYKIWRELYFGRCGPAAVAINHQLFDGQGQYVVLIRRGPRNGLPRRWRGHVLVLYGDILVDYMGETSWTQFVDLWGDAMERSTILLDVSEREIYKHFVAPCDAFRDQSWVLDARASLVRALTEEDAARQPKKKHAKRQRKSA